MPTLVTGATGLVGNNVVRLLLERGRPVRALAREGSDPRPLAGLDVETVHGDVRDAGAMRRACRGAEAVIHCAAEVRIGWTGLERMRAVNAEGTRHVADAAREAGARMVHVSSCDTLAPGTADAPADEDTPGEHPPCGYVVTKREAESIVLDLAREGLDAVVVNPAFTLGPWDWKPSTGEMLLIVARRFTPLAPRGGMSICDVRDVAAGILVALERGRAGRRYILGGHNLTYLEAWRLFADVAGGKGPWRRASRFSCAIGGWCGDVWAKVSGREPPLNSAGVAMSSQYNYYSSARAMHELGYERRPLRRTVEDAWQWFVENGY